MEQHALQLSGAILSVDGLGRFVHILRLLPSAKPGVSATPVHVLWGKEVSRSAPPRSDDSVRGSVCMRQRSVNQRTSHTCGATKDFATSVSKDYVGSGIPCRTVRSRHVLFVTAYA